MSTSLIPANTTDMMTVAKALAESGYFQDAKGAAQAFVKVQAGAEVGLPPFQAMSGIHIISGKPVLGAGLIASIIKRSGKYDYRVRETTDAICSIDFFQGAENIGNSTFTIDQARKAGVKNLDKFAQNMLFARAISNGAKWFTPDVFGGPIYTEGEIVEERAPYTREVTQQIEEATAEVVHEAKPVAAPAPKLTKEELAAAMKSLTEWQNGIDTLPNLATSYTEHTVALRELKGIKGDEKLTLFNKFKAIALEKGFDYDDKKKEFFVATIQAQPVAEDAETTEAVEVKL